MYNLLTNFRSSNGFTLIELLVTLAIFGVLAALAAPSFVSYGVRNSLGEVTNNFTSSVMLSRNEAIGKNTCVTMCMSSTVNETGTGALGPVCAASGNNWQNGWIAFLNPDCNPNLTFPAITNPDGSTSSQPQNFLFVRQQGVADISLISQASNRVIFFNSKGSIRPTDAEQFNTVYKNSNDPMTTQYASNICVDIMGRTRNIKSSSNCN